MKRFECVYFPPDEVKIVRFEATASSLRGFWQRLYYDLFQDRPQTAMAVQPTTQGIYTLERIK